MTDAGVELNRKNRTPWCFWVLGAVLVLYVAMCTGQRDSLWDTDSWEHHRAVVALVRNLWHAGNPVLAVDIPSIRYSPFSVVLAVICRGTGWDAYDVLSGAGVFNMVLLLVAVWALLKSFGEQRIATVALVVMVTLYGKTPGYPNSFALVDLPWHAVNPSSFAFALVVFAGALMRWMTGGTTPPTMTETRRDEAGRSTRRELENDERRKTKGERRATGAGRMLLLGWAALLLLMTEAMLDHGMTGVFGFLLLGTIAITRAKSVRWKWLGGVVLLGLAVAGACTQWPWFSFVEALRTRNDVDYWFNAGIVKRMLLEWTAPAVLLSAAAFLFWQREMVRTLLIGAAVCWGVTLFSCLIKSPTLARFPLPGMLLLDLPIAVFVYESGLMRCRTWKARLRALIRRKDERQKTKDEMGATPGVARAALEVMVGAMLLYCLVPQLLAVPVEPQLARVWVAKFLHRPDKQLHLKARFDDLLNPSADGTWAGIGAEDVVFSDPWTSWPIPSSRGKVVAAHHLELFVPDQVQRRADAEKFFGHISDAERVALLKKYDAKWILLNPAGPEAISPWAWAEIYKPSAVVRSEPVRDMGGNMQEMFLMDVGKWIAAGR